MRRLYEVYSEVGRGSSFKVSFPRAAGLRAQEVADVRNRALRELGGVEQIKKICRDARGTATIDALVRDTRESFANPDRLVDIYQNAANAGGVDAGSSDASSFATAVALTLIECASAATPASF